MSDKVIADLGRDRDLVAIFRERLGDVFLAQTIAISIRCIEKRDTQIERLAHEGEGLAFGVVSPPPSGNCPHSETDFANRQVAVLVSAEPHAQKLNAQATFAQAAARQALKKVATLAKRGD